MTIQAQRPALGYSKPSNCSLVIASYPNLNEDILTSGVPWVNALGGGGAPSEKVTNARERSSRAGGRVWEGVSPSQDREIFQFLRSKSSDLVHAVMRFLTLYLIRIWIKMITYIHVAQHIPKQDLNLYN